MIAHEKGFKFHAQPQYKTLPSKSSNPIFKQLAYQFKVDNYLDGYLTEEKTSR